MRNSKTAEVLERFAEKRRRAENECEQRCIEVNSIVPGIKEIDAELRSTSVTVLDAILSGEDVEKKLAELKEHNTALREKMKSLLVGAGYPADYTEIRFECEKCSDTGFVGTKVCECLKKAVAIAALEDSGIGKLAKTQGFDTFDFKYYTGEALESAKHNFKTLKDFAENFSPDSPKNFLLMGATGLGKTHLSTSVAKVVIEKGYKVVYDTIDGVLSDFEAERFKDTMTDDELSERYFKCDLLIIDDLGCEVKNQFTVSCLYSLVNTRINQGRSTVINTNLTYEELRDVYADRITSRVFGEFIPLVFKGSDIRRLKLIK